MGFDKHKGRGEGAASTTLAQMLHKRYLMDNFIFSSLPQRADKQDVKMFLVQPLTHG